MFEQVSLYNTDLLTAIVIHEKEELGVVPNNAPYGFAENMYAPITSKDVLVVDDDPFLSAIMTDVLKAEGHTTRVAANGQEAIERIRERKPQIILLDLMMPVMNGWELAAMLKTNPDWEDIPLVLITAAHKGAYSKYQNIDVKAVLRKPFDIDALAEVVQIYAS